MIFSSHFPPAQDDDRPKCVEISKYTIPGPDGSYDYSWIKGDVLFKIVCRDGVVLIVLHEWPDEMD